MNLRIVFLLAFFLVAGNTFPPLFAQEAHKECFRIVGSTSHDFGEIEQTDTVEHTFVFENTCDEDVEIAYARASCGCTAAVISDKLLAPGEQARIHVKFTPTRGSRGRVSKVIRVFLEGEEKEHSMLRIIATVRTDIDIQPSYIQLKDLTVGERVSTKSTITNTSDKEIFVETTGVNFLAYVTDSETGGQLTKQMDGGTVTPTEMRLVPGEQQDFIIEVTPMAPGQFNGSVGLKIGQSAAVIYVFGVVKGMEAQQE
ncbi:MAG: DUF1573 domain-containing protein [Bacteroidetes bacterium]|nr:DUF1573 domain-containing protein [Bacteroidota bacterium]